MGFLQDLEYVDGKTSEGSAKVCVDDGDNKGAPRGMIHEDLEGRFQKAIGKALIGNGFVLQSDIVKVVCDYVEDGASFNNNLSLGFGGCSHERSEIELSSVRLLSKRNKDQDEDQDKQKGKGKSNDNDEDENDNENKNKKKGKNEDEDEDAEDVGVAQGSVSESISESISESLTGTGTPTIDATTTATIDAVSLSLSDSVSASLTAFPSASPSTSPSRLPTFIPTMPPTMIEDYDYEDYGYYYGKKGGKGDYYDYEEDYYYGKKGDYYGDYDYYYGKKGDYYGDYDYYYGKRSSDANPDTVSPSLTPSEVKRDNGSRKRNRKNKKD